jgi:PAS domain S-box-containing protein
MAPPRHDRLALAASLGLAALIVASGYAAVSYRDAIRWIDHTLEVQRAASEWNIGLLEADVGARDYVLSGLPSVPAPFQAALVLERARAATTRVLVSDNPAQIQNVEAADRDALAAVDTLRELVTLAKAGHRDEALALVAAGRSRQRLDAFSADVQRIDEAEDRLLAERRPRSSLLAPLTFGGGALLAFTSVALLASSWKLQRRRTELSERLIREARQRLETLSDVASALAAVRSRSQVAAVVVDRGMRATGADTCTLYMLDDTGAVLELIGERGVAPEVVQKIRRITETAGSPETFATLRSGRALWAENDSDYAAIFPGLAATKAQGRRARAFWSMPLVVEGRPVGLLGMGFYDSRTFAPEEKTFIETFTQQCAQALVRAAHLEREDEAQMRFATTLRSIGDGVIATDPQGVVTFMNVVAEQLTGWSGSEARGRRLDEVFAIFSEQTGEIAESPVTKVLREGTVVGLANHTVLRARQGARLPIHDSAAPIRDASDRLFGVVLVFRDATAEKHEQAQRDFLARAGEALVSSLDYRAILGTVARFAVPELADWCAIAIKEPGDAASQQVAVAHVDPGKVAFARELGERYPPDPGARTGVPEVIRTGKSELYTEIPAAVLEAGARDAEHLRMIRELRLESAMVVPLRGRAGTLGAMTFVFADSGRRYTEADLAFAEDFARRAALAIENARTMSEVEDGRAREHALRREAEVANRAKDEFLATVSHELRTPLNAILGWTVTLRSRKPDAEFDRPLAIVERNARAQAKLIEDVLDVSRIISGKLALSLGPTNVAEAIQASVETVTPAADAKEIALSVDVENGPLTISADAERLQQVVEPPEQRGEVHAQGRKGLRARLPRGPGHRHPRERLGRRHKARRAAGRLRAVPAGGRLHDAPTRRPRPRAGDREAPRHRSRRDDPGQQRRRGQGRDVRRSIAGEVGRSCRRLTGRPDRRAARSSTRRAPPSRRRRRGRRPDARGRGPERAGSRGAPGELRGRSAREAAALQAGRRRQRHRDAADGWLLAHPQDPRALSRARRTHARRGPHRLRAVRRRPARVRRGVSDARGEADRARGAGDGRREPRRPQPRPARVIAPVRRPCPPAPARIAPLTPLGSSARSLQSPWKHVAANVRIDGPGAKRAGRWVSRWRSVSGGRGDRGRSRRGGRGHPARLAARRPRRGRRLAPDRAHYRRDVFGPLALPR